MDSAKLSFYHKYKLFLGYNGAIIQVGTPNSTGGWAYKYVQPTQMYNSNLNLERMEYDDFGQPMLWCWNGISGSNLFDWEYAEFDLSQFIGQPRVRINFTLVLYGGGSGGGWWVDDVEVRVSRINRNPVEDSSRDQWEWTNRHSHSGEFSWWNHNATTDHLSGGLDNSLYTRAIDLTNARNATLTAYMRFNINTSSGRPPDGFRVEVTSDNGRIWKPINLGARTSWGVSGKGADTDDNVTDGKSFAGIDPDGDGWIEAGTLTRLSTDLSGWRGSVIELRFRVITSTDDNPFWSGAHYQDPGAGFGGLSIDDVIIYGESLQAENEVTRSLDNIDGPVNSHQDSTIVDVIEKTPEEPLQVTVESLKKPTASAVLDAELSNGNNEEQIEQFFIESNDFAPENEAVTANSGSSPSSSSTAISYSAFILIFIIFITILFVCIRRR
jgi:hypothetical protein